MKKLYFSLFFLFIFQLVPAQKKALNFDGINDYVETNTNIINLQNAPFTVEVWIKTTGVNMGIINLQNNNGGWEGGERVFYLDSSGKPTLVGNGNGFMYSTQSVNDDNWHHIAWVWSYTGNACNIYIDGVDATDSSSWYNPNNSNISDGTFKLGQPNYSESTNYFSGSMYGVRFWNVARSSADILNNKDIDVDPTTSGLVAQYDFNQGIAGGTNLGVTTLLDKTTNAYSATLNNFALTGSSSNWVGDITGSLAITNAGCSTNGTLLVTNLHSSSFANFIATDFSSQPSNSDISGDAIIINNECILTPAQSGTQGYLAFNTVPNTPLAFTASFDYRCADGSGADGTSFNYGLLSSINGNYENGINSGLSIKFIEYGTSRVVVTYNGQDIESANFNLINTNYRNCVISVSNSGLVTVSIGGSVVISGAQLPANYITDNKASWQYFFSARCGGANNKHSIQNLYIGSSQSTQTFEYSLDNANWQTSSSFSVGEGNYSVYVRVITNAIPSTSYYIGNTTIQGVLPVLRPIVGNNSLCEGSNFTLTNATLQTSQPFAVAYSVRKVVSSYSGFALQIRRDNDNATLDIGFTPSGDLDVNAISNFVGSNNAFISVWYDQSTNGRHLIKSDTYWQPQIVFSGNFKYIGTRVAIDFSNNKSLAYSGSLSLASITAVVRSEYNNFQSYQSILDGSPRIGGLLTAGGTNFYGDASQLAVWRDGISLGISDSLSPITEPMVLSYNSRTYNLSQIFIGNYDNGGDGGSVLEAEAVAFANVFSSEDKAFIENQQIAYYSVPTSGSTNYISLDGITGAWSSSDTQIATIDSTTGVVTAVSGGSTTINYTITNATGCQEIVSKLITIESMPVVIISASSTSINVGESATLTASGANSYFWGFDNTTPLDNVSPSGLAVGLRKLKSTYSGSAIRLRRDSDNAEADFGFVATELNTDAISTWLNGANGYCVILYDQSGSGNNMTPSNSDSQPLFVLNGLNNKPILRFNTSQNLGNATNFSPPFTVIYGGKQTGANRNRVMSSMGNNWLLGWWGGSKGAAHFDGWITANNIPSDNNAYVYSGTGNGSTSDMYENGVSKTTNSYGGQSGPDGISINHNEPSNSDITEIYAFHSLLSTTDREAVEKSIGSYYGIFGDASLGSNASITVTPTKTTTYSVKGYSANGLCSTTTTANITVIYNTNLNNFNDITKSFYDVSYVITPPTSNSLGTFTYTSSNTSVATINNGIVTFVGPGTTIITAIQAANGPYLSDSITATLTVNSVSVVSKNGSISNASMKYVNKNGAIAGFTGLSSNGEIIKTKTPYNALNFSGSLQNYASLPPATYFSGDFTIECWVYPTAYNNWSRIIDFGNGTSNNVLFATSMGTTGKPGFYVGGIQYAANDQIPLNQWTHLAATLSGTTATIYINGIASGTANFPVPANVIRNDNYIGRSNWGWGDPAPSASFDDLRIWNVAKTPTQILEFMNKELSGNESNLVTYFKFNEGVSCGNNSSITTLLNSSSSGAIYNATLHEFTLNGSCTSNFVAGKITSQFDGLTAASAGSSAFQIKTNYPNSGDGLYWIKNPSINGGTPFQIYADMTTDGGGWTLILCNNDNAGWDANNAILRNETIPTINGQYSIIAYADYIKKSASGFQYMIDASTRGQWGGIWTANQDYSFVHTANDQTNITLNTKFNTWDYNDGGVEQIMPWYAPNHSGTITTSSSPDGGWWGTLVSISGFSPAPWMGCCGNSNPGIIWYWVR